MKLRLFKRARRDSKSKVAVVVCSFNRLKLLKKCIKSILAHKSGCYEIIVIDAGSTDGTSEYLAELGSVKVIRDKGRIGQARSLNRVCLNRNNGYLCWLSDDNELIPPCLDVVKRILDKHKDIGMVSLKVKDVTGPGKQKDYIGGLAKTGVLNCNQGMIRCDLFKRLGGFDEVLRDYFIDVDLTTRVLLAGYKVAVTKAVAIKHYRNHGTNSWIEPEGRKRRTDLGRAFYELRYSFLVEDRECFEAGPEHAARMAEFKRVRAFHESKVGFLLGRNIYNEQDWRNLKHARFISLSDFKTYCFQPFYLVQAIPEDLRRAAKVKMRKVTMADAAQRLALGGAAETLAGSSNASGKEQLACPGTTLSFVIGSYNRGKLLRGTIQNIRLQGVAVPYEIIVIDGGSTDGSLEWLVAQKDVITIVQHNRGEANGKPVERKSWGYFMNLGFKAAHGRYILMLSDDCLMLPNAVNRALAQLSALGSQGRNIGGLAFYFRNWPEEKEYYVQKTLGGNLMVNHGIFVRSALEAVGWVDEDRYRFYKADSDVCLRMWQAGYEIVDCPGVFVEHYVDPAEAVRQTNNAVMDQDRVAYKQRWLGIYHHPGEPSQISRLHIPFDDPSHTADFFRDMVNG